MYESFYQFHQTPFRLTPDPGFYYESATHRHALDYLRYAILQDEGFVVITGDPGTGKTELMLTLIEELCTDRITYAKIVTSNLHSIDLLRLMASAFGLSVKTQSKFVLLKRLEEFFIAQARQRKRVLLLIDEAHCLSKSSYLELAILADFQLGEKTLFQCFLLGQSILANVMVDSDLVYLKHKVIAAAHLFPLSEAETRDYIIHRLMCAGSIGDPKFSDKAIEMIYANTGGNPRQINYLCSRLLLKSYLDESKNIVEESVQFVLNELQSTLQNDINDITYSDAPVEYSEINRITG